jgi:hypothetical protein
MCLFIALYAKTSLSKYVMKRCLCFSVVATVNRVEKVDINLKFWQLLWCDYEVCLAEYVSIITTGVTSSISIPAFYFADDVY